MVRGLPKDRPIIAKAKQGLPKKMLHLGDLVWSAAGGSGLLPAYPPGNNFIGLSKSLKNLGIQGVLGMGQLVFALRHHLNLPHPPAPCKGCVMVMADHLDLGHGQKVLTDLTFARKLSNYIFFFNRFVLN